MSNINIRNKGLRDAFAGMLADNKIGKAEVHKLLDQANKDGTISGREKADLVNILKNAGDKFDAAAKQTLAKALGLDAGTGRSHEKLSTGEFEARPMRDLLVGEKANAAHADDVLSTGVSLDASAPAWSRSQLTPKLGQEKLTRRESTDANGDKTVEFFKANGHKLTAEETRNVLYANAGVDGHVDAGASMGWWGECDAVALPGILFQEPLKDHVMVDDVTFTRQDMLDILTTVAGSQRNPFVDPKLVKEIFSKFS